MTDTHHAPSVAEPSTLAADTALIAELQAELAALKSENEDLRMLYEATIEHGEAVEDQLAESNILLQDIQDRLKEEINDARRYVLSLLPEPRLTLPLTQWLLVPSTELGGDAFGYHDIDPDHFAIYLLDVCGHGVGAALLTASVINVLRAGALPSADFRDPSAVLEGLNSAFPMEKHNNMFFTLWYGVYQRSSNVLTFANGGHPPAILLRGDRMDVAEAIALAADGGMAIGAIADVAFVSDRMAIESGDRLIVVSDGTFEIGLDGAAQHGFDDLVEICRKPGGDLAESVLDWTRRENGGDTLPDDFTYLRVEF